jgi:hypothetical protein
MERHPTVGEVLAVKESTMERLVTSSGEVLYPRSRASVTTAFLASPLAERVVDYHNKDPETLEGNRLASPRTDKLAPSVGSP